MTAPIPLTLARFLHDMHQRGEIVLTPPAKPSHVRAVMTGVSEEWRPTYPGEEAPF